MALTLSCYHEREFEHIEVDLHKVDFVDPKSDDVGLALQENIGSRDCVEPFLRIRYGTFALFKELGTSSLLCTFSLYVCVSPLSATICLRYYTLQCVNRPIFLLFEPETRTRDIFDSSPFYARKSAAASTKSIKSLEQLNRRDDLHELIVIEMLFVPVVDSKKGGTLRLC
jgi:hypothetical protein